MSLERRDFIISLGISIASLVLARCTSLDGGTEPTQSQHLSNKERIRQCWNNLGDLAAQTLEDFEFAEQLKAELITNHRTALDKLVASGEISAAEAEQVQIAFQEATYHVWRLNAPITCYEPAMIDYAPTSRGQLTQQVALLSELAVQADINMNTIAQAQAAIERDMAFLGLTNDEEKSLYEELIAAAGETYNYPSFDELDLDVSPSAIDAARFLVEVLLDNE
jgi:hypothetical protein